MEYRKWTIEDLPEIYTRYYRLMVAAATKYGAGDRAEDFAQAAFVRFIEKFDVFRSESEISSYLYRICVNEVLMHYRKKATRVEISVGAASAIAIYGNGAQSSPPETNAFRAYNQSVAPNQYEELLVDEVSERLAKGYRTVLFMHDYEGYEHEELAKILGIQGGTSKSQLHKARKKAKEILKNVTDKLHKQVEVRAIEECSPGAEISKPLGSSADPCRPGLS